MSITILKINQYVSDKRFLISFYLLYFGWLTISFLTTPFQVKPWEVYLFVGLYCPLEIVTTASVIKRRVAGDVIVFKQKSAFKIWVIPLLTLYVVQYEVVSISRPWLGGFLVVFCLMALAELIYVILVGVYKPAGMVINGNELVLYDRVINRRNINSLAMIKLSDLENNIVFTFDRQYRIAVVIKEYSKQDLLEFIATAISLSKLQVYVHPDVYKKLQPRRPQPPQPLLHSIGKILKDTFLP